MFKLYNEQAKTEILLSLTVRTPDLRTRAELIKNLSATEKQTAAKILQESLPAVENIPELASGITELLKALGSAPAQTSTVLARGSWRLTKPRQTPNTAEYSLGDRAPGEYRDWETTQTAS